MTNFIQQLTQCINTHNPFRKTITDLQVTETSEGKSYWLTYKQFSFGINLTKTLYGSYNQTYKSVIWYNDNYVMVALPKFDVPTSGSHYNLLTSVLK